MEQRTALPTIAVVILTGFLAACPSPAAVTRPDLPTYAAAVPTAVSCTQGAGAKVMTLDMPGEERAELEAALARGLVGVAYDCHKLVVRPQCLAEGRYTYVPVTRKEETIELRGAQEIAANLPVASLGAELERSASLVAELVLVGRRAASSAYLDARALRGPCADVTHYVAAVTVGAFSLKSAARSKAGVEAKVLEVGASSRGESERHIVRSDGQREACAASTLESTAPPAGCGALLQLELASLGRAQEGRAAGAASASARTAWYCPVGTAWQGSRCAAVGSEGVCGSDNIEICASQCDRGIGSSCADLGFFYWVGRIVGKDDRRALEVWQKGCEAGDGYCCQNAGIGTAAGRGVPRDLTRGIALLREACGALPSACRNLGALLADARWVGSPDYGAARRYYQRACDGGDFEGCRDLGGLYADGKGVSRDSGHARTLYHYACQAGDGTSCRVLGALHHEGDERFARDRVRARAYLERGCALGEPQACGLLGAYYFDGIGGLARDTARGEQLASRSCEQHALGCVILETYYRNQGDRDREARYRRRACELGSGDACKRGEGASGGQPAQPRQAAPMGPTPRIPPPPGSP